MSKHPAIQRGPRGQNPHGMPDEGFDEFFERYFGRPAPEMPQEFKGSSLGSGFILNARRLHPHQQPRGEGRHRHPRALADGREFTAKVVGRDPAHGRRAAQAAGRRGLPAAPLGDSDALRVGDFVLAIGNPFGLPTPSPLGIVSAKARGIGAGALRRLHPDRRGHQPRQLAAARSSTCAARWSASTPPSRRRQGIGFAIPVNMAKALLPQLARSGKVTRGFLGVSSEPLTPTWCRPSACRRATGRWCRPSSRGRPPARRA